MEINVKDLRKHFGQTRAVDGISFGFASGHIFGFVGPNGAGKTTTMRIMATLDEPTSGDVFLDGVSVVEEPEQARRRVGFVPDSLPTHRDMTVHEYLDFFARAYGLRGRRRITTVLGVEEFTNLLGIREKMVAVLSKGMKQRVSVARALLHDPPVLVMDEPAAGLDPRARIELRELLKVLAGQGKAILISSHILTELAEICDGAIIIEQGKLLRAGKMNEILTAGDGAAPQTIVIIRVEGESQMLHRDLLEMPHVKSVRAIGREIEVELDGPETVACAVLTILVQKGHRVLEFRHRRAQLEDLFMTVTKGNVQ